MIDMPFQFFRTGPLGHDILTFSTLTAITFPQRLPGFRGVVDDIILLYAPSMPSSSHISLTLRSLDHSTAHPAITLPITIIAIGFRRCAVFGEISGLAFWFTFSICLLPPTHYTVSILYYRISFRRDPMIRSLKLFSIDASLTYSSSV